MTTMLESGHAEKVVWYIPHHGVYHKDKPEKNRIVFDCSAKFRGISLNDCLYQGPDLTNSLIGVLLRFRQERIAIQGDIESIFYQVQVPVQDRNLMRFLWRENGQLETDLQEYRMCVYVFGAVCSPSCANFALQQTAEQFKDRYDPAVVNIVKRSFYVDDCLVSAPSVETAKTLLLELKNLLKEGGFNFVKWTSNNQEVIEAVPRSDRSKLLHDLDLGKDVLPKERALGLCWNAETDSLRFSY